MSTLAKKIFLFTSIIISCLFISNYALANDNTTMMNMVNNGVNTVRNAVGGTENAIENMANATTTTVREGMDKVGNTTENMMNDGNYSATRTDTGGTTTRSATTTSATNTTSNNLWTWLIVGTIALIAVGVIWYMTTRNGKHSNR